MNELQRADGYRDILQMAYEWTNEHFIDTARMKQMIEYILFHVQFHIGGYVILSFVKFLRKRQPSVSEVGATDKSHSFLESGLKNCVLL